MNNFERIKKCEDEHEMSDLICGFIGNNLHKMTNKEKPYFDCLPFLRWLQSNRNIYDEE